MSGAVRSFLDLKHNATYTVPFTIVICTFGVTLTIVSLLKQYLHYFSKTKGQKNIGSDWACCWSRCYLQDNSAVIYIRPYSKGLTIDVSRS